MKNPQFYNVLIKPLGDANINEVLKVNPCYPRHWRVHTGVVVKRGVGGGEGHCRSTGYFLSVKNIRFEITWV